MMRKQSESCCTAVGSWAEKQKVLGLSIINVVRRTQRVCVDTRTCRCSDARVWSVSGANLPPYAAKGTDAIIQTVR